MKIKIDSNFVISGVDNKDEIKIYDRASLRMLLEEISSKRVIFIRPGRDCVDAFDFELAVNGIPLDGSKDSLEMPLSEGDVVSIKISMLGGG